MVPRMQTYSEHWYKALGLAAETYVLSLVWKTGPQRWGTTTAGRTLGNGACQRKEIVPPAGWKDLYLQGLHKMFSYLILSNIWGSDCVCVYTNTHTHICICVYNPYTYCTYYICYCYFIQNWKWQIIWTKRWSQLTSNCLIQFLGTQAFHNPG